MMFLCQMDCVSVAGVNGCSKRLCLGVAVQIRPVCLSLTKPREAEGFGRMLRGS